MNQCTTRHDTPLVSKTFDFSRYLVFGIWYLELRWSIVCTWRRHAGSQDWGEAVVQVFNWQPGWFEAQIMRQAGIIHFIFNFIAWTALGSLHVNVNFRSHLRTLSCLFLPTTIKIKFKIKFKINQGNCGRCRVRIDHVPPKEQLGTLLP